MKAITLKQPFASLIASGLKEYEFRTWKTAYRGEILLLRFAKDLEEYSKVDSMPVLEGKRMTIMLSAKKAAPAKKEKPAKPQQPAAEPVKED